jgi:hypothetical protein
MTFSGYKSITKYVENIFGLSYMPYLRKNDGYIYYSAALVIHSSSIFHPHIPRIPNLSSSRTFHFNKIRGQYRSGTVPLSYMLKWKVLEENKEREECKECEECEDGRCWRNVLLMQQSSIYSRHSFVGSACGTIRTFIYFQQVMSPASATSA